MYKYQPPKPIVIDLCDEEGYNLRIKAQRYLQENINLTGAERGSQEEQGFGVLAEVVIRKYLGIPEIPPKDHPAGYDILLPSRVRLDVKCRGGVKPFKEEYEGPDNLSREAKHNFFARQVYDPKLNTDIYLMTHLETPQNRTLPGTKRQRKWKLYVCGWVSKERVIKEGVYLPRGSLTEQGKTWFPYRGQEIEFYNKNLNGLKAIKNLLTLDPSDVIEDKTKRKSLNLTIADAVRIGYDLFGRGILDKNHLEAIKGQVGLKGEVYPVLHPNQYFHLMEWLKDRGAIGEKELNKLKQAMEKVEYKGI